MLTRALKEVRSLLLPAGLILGATALSFAWSATGDTKWALSALSRQIAVVSFILGTALLAASSFGSEFQQRTLVLLLSQPLTRSRLWLEKWLVLVGVAGILGATQFAILRVGPFEPGRAADGALLYLVAIVCSAPFWTLVARSTIGGAAFSVSAIGMLELAANVVAERIYGPDLSPGPFAGTVPLTAARVAYCIGILWLGWRVFSRFEVRSAGDASSADPAASTPSWSVLRCRPDEGLRNLFRKEVCLHRPTFQIAGLFAVCWLSVLALFSLQRWSRDTAEAAFSFLIAVYLPLSIVLAGAISVGEDTTLGLRAWHLTLPVSARVQWLAKLVVALLVGVALAIVLPLVLVVLTSAMLPLELGLFHGLKVLMQPMTTISVASAVVLSFWASTLFGHTVRAALATGLAAIALSFCVSIAFRFGFNFAPGTSLVTSLVVRLQLPPDYFHGLGDTSIVLTSFFTIVPLLALRQSFTAFRRVDIDVRTIVRHATILLGAAALIMFCFAAINSASYLQRFSVPVRELEAALQALPHPDTPATEPRRVTVGELDATGRLSPATKGWLANAEISVMQWGKPGSYKASVGFPNNRKYALVYSPRPTRY